MAHTPGPWRVVCGSAFAVETAESPPRRICSLSYASHAVSARIPNEETLANADLVAAAPTLAAVLLDAVAAWASMIDDPDTSINGSDAVEWLADFIPTAHAALVKAKVAA